MSATGGATRIAPTHRQLAMTHATPSPAPRDLALQSALAEHGPFLRRLARALVRDEHAADDLVQDTWTAALRQHDGTVRSRAWLATVLRRRAISQRRRAGASDPASIARERSNAAPAADDVAVTLERERVLHEAIEALDEPYRTAVFLRYHEELAPREIAKRLDVSVKTVDTRLARGRVKLREDLDRRFGDEDDPRAAWLSAFAPLAAPEFGTASALSGGVVALAFTAAASIVTLVVWLFAFQGGGTEPTGSNGPELAAVSKDPTVAWIAAPENALAEALPSPTAREGVVPPPTSSAMQGASLAVVLTDETSAAIEDRVVMLIGPTGTGRRADYARRRTDEEGRASFQGLAPGRYRVRDARDTADEWLTLAADEERTISWTVVDEFTVRGRVVLPDGTPVPDATIWVGPKGTGAPLLLPLATSNSAGGFEFTASDEARIQASIPGRLPSRARFASFVQEVEPGVREVDLVLGEAGRTVSGRVLDGSGAPIEGASVVAGPIGGSGSRSAGRAPFPVTVTTDADGRFEYGQALPDGAQTIAAFAPGFAATRQTLAAGGANVVELVLEGGATVRGTVVRPDGTPAARAVVRVTHPDDRELSPSRVPTHAVAADDDGRFSFSLVGPGAQHVHARAHHEEPLSRASEDIVAAAGTTHELTLQLSDEPSIAGRVVDRDGIGVEGVRIDAEGSRFPQSHSNAPRTAADGSFRLTCLDTIPYGPQLWTIEAFVMDGRSLQTLGSKAEVPIGTDDVLITIDRPVVASAYLEGRILPEPGTLRVPADIEFVLWREDTSKGFWVTIDPDTGRFREGPLVPGTHRLTGNRQDTVVLRRSGIEIGAGETVDVGDLVLGEGGRVEIRATLADDLGAPASTIERLLENAQVTIVHRGVPIWLDREDGRWVSNEIVEPGTWELRAESRQLVFPMTTLEVVDDQTTTKDLVLRVGQSPDVVVAMPSGGNWTRVRLVAVDGDGTLVARTDWAERSGLDASNTATFEPTLPFGEATLTVETDTNVRATKSVTVPDYRSGIMPPVEIDAR